MQLENASFYSDLHFLHLLLKIVFSSSANIQTCDNNEPYAICYLDTACSRNSV
jgi:hypothetical protein